MTKQINLKHMHARLTIVGFLAHKTIQKIISDKTRTSSSLILKRNADTRGERRTNGRCYKFLKFNYFSHAESTRTYVRVVRITMRNANYKYCWVRSFVRRQTNAMAKRSWPVHIDHSINRRRLMNLTCVSVSVRERERDRGGRWAKTETQWKLEFKIFSILLTHFTKCLDVQSIELSAWRTANVSILIESQGKWYVKQADAYW